MALCLSSNEKELSVFKSTLSSYESTQIKANGETADLNDLVASLKSKIFQDERDIVNYVSQIKTLKSSIRVSQCLVVSQHPSLDLRSPLIENAKALKLRILSLTRTLSSREADIKSLSAILANKERVIFTLSSLLEKSSDLKPQSKEPCLSERHRLLGLERLCRINEDEIARLKASLSAKVRKEEARLASDLERVLELGGDGRDRFTPLEITSMYAQRLQSYESQARLYKKEALCMSREVVRMANDSERILVVVNELEVWINRVCVGCLSSEKGRSLYESYQILSRQSPKECLSPQDIPFFLHSLKSLLLVDAKVD